MALLPEGVKDKPREGQFSSKTGFFRRGLDLKKKGTFQRLQLLVEQVVIRSRFSLWGNRSPFYNLFTVVVHLLWIGLFSLPPILFVSWVVVSSTLLDPT